VVFGGTGQLGQDLSATAARDGVALAAIDRAEADITDRAAVARVIAERRPTLVVNAAAYNAVDKAEREPDAAMGTNAEGAGVVAEACAGADVPVVHLSTDYVFGGEKAGAYDEDDPVGPLSAYARSKAEGEAAVRRRAPRHLIIRTAWLFGVHGANFVKTVLKLAAERDALTMVADQHGSPTASADCARAILAAAAAIAGGGAPWGTYHFAGPTPATPHAMAERVVAAQAPFTGRAPAVEPVTSAAYGAAARRPRNSVLDSSRFAAAFGIGASRWEEAVDRTVAELLGTGRSA